ncbi:MAG: PKD domain-containing protein [Acidobacteria bacterium]|nr:PKD domain-containing protein [Acidobacteriota bacterium]
MLLLAAVVCLPSLAFADAQAINFRCIFQYCHDRFYALASVTFYNPNTADWTVEGGLGILDANEMEILQLILADPAAPHHAAVHAAFAQNCTKARSAIGSTIIDLTTSPATSGPTARQPIPGTSPQKYYAADGLMGAYVTMGEWDLYDVTMTAFKTSDFGSRVVWCVDEQAPACYVDKKPLYDLSQADYVNMCGDLDGDGVKNCNEYWGATPNGYAGALNPAVRDAAVTWSAWTCLDENNSSIRFAYNAVTDRVYTMSQAPMTFAAAKLVTGIQYPDGSTLPVVMATIRNAEENEYVRVLVNGESAWIGLTDEAVEGTWAWLSGEPLTYTNWDSGEPNNAGNEDYGQFKDDGTWNDGGDTERYVVFESSGTWPDADSNGAPDAFEDNNGDLIPDEFGVPLPIADFEADEISGDMPLKVQFTNLSLPNGPTITSWAWTFGDGGTSTLPNPTHTYMAADPLSHYTVSLAVTNANGTGTKTKTNYITVIYVCSWGYKMEDQAEVVAANPASVNAALAAALDLAGADTWIEWDLDSDLLPDAAQIAMLAYVACTSWHPLSASTYEALDDNEVLWRAQFAADAGLLANAEFFTGMAGLSADMQAALGTILGANLSGYAIYGLPSKVEAPLFSAGGDFDGDGLTNLVEWDAVVAYLGEGASIDAVLDMFIDAVTDPGNFGPYNPDLPVAGIVGLGLLVGSMLAGAALAMRKK